MTASNGDITFGDLVQVLGYGDTPFFVDGWTIEGNYMPGAEWSEVWFDLTNATNGEYYMAESNDISKVCDAARADDYLAEYEDVPTFNIGDLTLNIDLSEYLAKGAEEMFGGRKSESSLRNPELVRQREEDKRRARIDELLDDYNDAKALENIIEEDAEIYRKKADGILRMLEKLIE